MTTAQLRAELASSPADSNGSPLGPEELMARFADRAADNLFQPAPLLEPGTVATTMPDSNYFSNDPHSKSRRRGRASYI